MAGRKRLYLYWDPHLSAGFRRRMEAALTRLNIDVADGETVDTDPDDRGVVAAIASSAGVWAGPAKPDIVIQGGPGEFPHEAGALRLNDSDLEGDTPRWTRLLERLRGELGLASLALPADELEARLNDSAQRVAEAERNASTAALNEANAVRESRQAKLELSAARKRIAELEDENDRLRKLNESGRFAIGAVPQNVRSDVANAREHARHGELTSTRAAEAAAAHPDQIAWSGALYSGETRNGKPHGAGVMVFLSGKKIIASYRGEFRDGKRDGAGIGVAQDGLVWSGQWAADTASGFGILEAPDGRRFEGRVTPDDSGNPRPVTGWKWDAPHNSKQKPTHHAVARSLPAPSGLAD